jgi:uncharacterized protein
MFENLFTYNNLIFTLIFCFAYFIFGLIGFGSGSFGSPILVLLKFQLGEFTPIFNFFNFFNAAINFHRFHVGVNWVVVRSLLYGSLAGALVGAYIQKNTDLKFILPFLLFMILIFSLNNIFEFIKLALKHNLLNGILFGFLTALTSSLFGITGPIPVLYLIAVLGQGSDIKPNISCYFMFSGLIQVVIKYLFGLITIKMVFICLFLIPILPIFVLLGTILGNKLNKHVLFLLINSSLVLICLIYFIKPF